MNSGNLSNLGTLLQPEYFSKNEASDKGDMEKVVAMATLGLGSFLSGMLPALISERNRRSYPLAISLLSCFGAGILLATALVHILPEVRSQMKSNLAEVALCGGFFIIYFIDEFIHYFFGEAIQHNHEDGGLSNHNRNYNNRPAARAESNHNHNTYGSNDERRPLLQQSQHDHNHSHNSHSHNSHSHNSHSQDLEHTHEHSDECKPPCDDNVVADANARICHTSHQEPCVESMTGTLGLFVALSLHSAIEGIAIGVQNSATKVYFLLGAVACHKFVMGFCLGLAIRSSSRNNLKSQIVGISVFAFGAIIGIGIGMLIVDVPSEWMTKTLPIIQALAGGTLFYVTVCEVISKEKARWHQNSQRKAAGFGQFFAVALGFTTMTLINFFISDGDND